MKLTIFNGSPRGKNSNSSLIINWITEEIKNQDKVEIDIVYLKNILKDDNTVEKLQVADTVIIVFPLYTDCMPGVVMAFIEKLEPLIGGLQGKKLGFVVHSGFPEACQSRYIERYIVWLANELKANYMGTAILGSSEGFRIMPDSMTKKKRLLFNRLGISIIQKDNFDPELIRQIAGTERLSKTALLLYRLGAKLGIANIYWNGQLKKNKAFEKRFARPYEKC